MSMSKLELSLWCSGFALNAILACILLIKFVRHRDWWFTVWICFGCVNTMVLYVTYRVNATHLYFWLYWVAAFLDLVLQLAVLLDISRGALQRDAVWIHGSRGKLRTAAAIAFLVALVLAITTKPAAETSVDGIFARANLFMTILFCLVLASIMFVSKKLGLAWGNRAAQVGYGLAVWNLVSFVTDTLHTYWRTMQIFSNLEYTRTITFQAVLVYWIFLYLGEVPKEQQPPMRALLHLETYARRRGRSEKHGVNGESAK